MYVSLHQAVLKPFYFIFVLIGGRTADMVNNALLSDWINRLTLAQISAAVSGVGISVVAAAVVPSIIK